MKTKWFLRTFAIIAGISFASCEDKNKEVTPVFPDVAEYTVAAGETKELNFTANTPWSLSTDQPTWCVFMDGDVERMQKTGQAGEITVIVKVNDVNHEFDADAVATISLTMQGEKEPIFKITRPGKTRQVTMYKRASGAWVEIPKVELEYRNGETVSLEIGFTANFAWKVLSASEGIVLGTALSGKANGTTSDVDFKTSYISLPKEMLSEPFSGEIVISDLNGENTTSLDVTYAGMGDNDLFFSDSHLKAGFDPSVSFSNKGYVISKDAIPQPTEEMSFSFTAFTKGMQSTGYIVSFDGETAQIATNPSWLVLTDKGNGNYTIAVTGDGANPGDARNLYVFILPEALASATPDFSPYFADGQSKGIYNFKVAQEAAPVEGLGFFIAWGWMQTPIADGKVVSFTEYPLFAGETASDWGLVNDKTYVYEFSNADVNGMLTIAPLGISFDSPVYDLQNADAWTEIAREGMWIDAIDGMGIAINNIKNNVPSQRMAYINFYESQEDKDSYKPASSVLILMQVP